MSSVPKILKMAVYIIVAAIAITSGVVLVRNASQKTPAIHEDSATDPKGVYEVYNNTLVTGNQVLTAIITYGNYEAPEPDKGLCRVRTGKTKAANPNAWSKYTDYKKEDADSWINPDGVFRATLVYGRDLEPNEANAATIANCPNELQWIQFVQEKQHDDPKDITPGPVTPDPTLPPDGQDIPDGNPVAMLTATGGMSLWEGTKREDITPSVQGVTIQYCGQDVTDSRDVSWDWDTVINDGSQKQQKNLTIRYQGKTATVVVWVYKDLDLRVDTNSTVDGHPVGVTTNHPDYEKNFNGFDGDDSADFRFIAYEENRSQKELFKKLTTQGFNAVPAHGDYVVANTKQGGATALAKAEMTVGVDDIHYTAERTKTQRITWSPLKVDYFNWTADDAYKNSGNYTDEETGLIDGAKDADAGTESLIATGDIIRLTCNTTADVDYKYQGWFNQVGAWFTGDRPIYDSENIPGDKDYTSSNSQSTVVSLKALRATEVGEAKVTFTDRVTGFQVASDDRFWTLYTPFSFDIPSYNLDTNSAIVRDDSYDTTDLVVTGSKSLTTTNDKKLYVDRLLDANDNGVATPEFVYAQYSKANSLTAQETEAATTVNGAVNNYTLDCQTQYSNKNVSTNKQGRSHLSAVYVDFGSRYTKEKIVYVWYPLKVEFTRPYDLTWDRDTNYSKVYTAEAIVATASQRDSAFSWSTDDLNATKISGGVDGTIQASNYAAAAPCKAEITNTYSSRSFAFTLKTRGSVVATATRPRTAETVVAPAIEFRPSVPDNLYNLTSAAAVGQTTPALVNEDTNRLACGDEFNYSYDPIGSYGFTLYKGNSSIKDTYNSATRQEVCKCKSDGINLDVSASGGLVKVTRNSISIAAANSDIFYAIEFTPVNRKYWFVDNPITKFENDAESTKGFNVYRFTDDYVNGFSDGFTIANIDNYRAWCHNDSAVILTHQYTASYSNASNRITNVGLQATVMPHTVKNEHNTDSVNSDTETRNGVLTITSGDGSIAGTPTSIIVSHDQFFGRQKKIEWLTFTNLSQEIHLVEMHDIKLNVGAGASTYLKLTGLPAKNSSGAALERKVEQSSATQFWFKKDYYANDKGYPQKVAISSNTVEIVTKQSGNKNFKVKMSNTKNGANYEIKMHVYDFEAKTYTAFNDNFGYTWSDGESSKGKIILTSSRHPLIGDKLAVVANSDTYSVTKTNNNNTLKIKYDGTNNDGKLCNYLENNRNAGFINASDAASVFELDVDEVGTFEKTLGNSAVKFYGTYTPYGGTPNYGSSLTTSNSNNVTIVPNTYNELGPVPLKLTIEDKAISNYYKNKSITNDIETSLGLGLTPFISITTAVYNPTNGIDVDTSHTHGSALAFPNMLKPANDYRNQSIDYAPRGTQALYNHFGLSGRYQNGITGTATDEKGFPYLHVSELYGGKGWSDVLSWSKNKGGYSSDDKAVTYRTMRWSGSTDTGFACKVTAANLASKECYNTDEYVYINTGGVNTAYEPKFIVSFAINGRDRKYIGWESSGDTVRPKLYRESDIFKNNSFKHTKEAENDYYKVLFSASDSKVPSLSKYGDETAIDLRSCNANNWKDSTIARGNLKEFCEYDSELRYENDGHVDNNPGVIRLNASALGWNDSSINYVDIYITVLDSGMGNRTYTFPIRYYPNTNPGLLYFQP